MKEQTISKGFHSFFSLIATTNVPKAMLISGLIGSVITTMTGLIVPILTKGLIDNFTLASIHYPFIFAIGAAFVIQAVISGISIFLLSVVGQRVVATIQRKMWDKLIHLPVRFFDQTASGKIASRIVNDTAVIKNLISDHFPQFISGVISIIGAVIILFMMDWKMTLVMLLSVPITILIMLPLGKQMAKISRNLQDEMANFTGNAQQTLGEIRLMKASNAEKTETSKGYTGIQNIYKLGIQESKIYALISPLMNFVLMAVIVVIISYGGMRVATGSLSTGSLVAFLLYLFQIVVPVTSFAMFFTQLQKAKGATERIIAILQEPLEEDKKGVSVPTTNQSITVEHVSFSYNEEKSILQDISFQANPGDVIAFAGPSGGGKTTMFALLERFYEPDNGEIKLGDTPIQSFSLQSWRKQIGYVSQDSPMMAGTIRENLCYGLEDQNISDERLWEVTKMAYADQFIIGFPQKLDTEIGERGIKLSGGQRQRIAIARAFLRNPKILLMDEATASLDSQSEGIVQEALSRLMEGRTTFMIAHRLSTIVHADHIIFIDKGKITGMGTHDKLLKTHALYREFAKQQLT